jgi:hypothetical protein
LPGRELTGGARSIVALAGQCVDAGMESASRDRGGPGRGGEGDGDLAVDDVDGADQVTGVGGARDLTVSREPVVGDRDLLAGRDGSR